jgi:uncharacterized protein (DUF4213/DUF364 family)
MNLIQDLIATLPEGQVIHVSIGLHWTAVVAEVSGQMRCGLASTLHNEHAHGVQDVPKAGKLEGLAGHDVAAFTQTKKPTLVSVGMAAINALLPQHPESWVNLNAEDVIAEHGAGKSVVLIGHFPFIPHLKPKVGELTILELDPQPGDLPVSSAQDVIPSADVLAITSMTLLNHTLEDLLAYANPDAIVIMLGPTTPLSPVLFDHGIDLLCGSVVSKIDPVLRAVRQGANFPQVHRAGVQLVSINRSLGNNV